jgi:hypothetical protein
MPARCGVCPSKSRDATRWQSHVKGLTIAANSIFDGWRMEDVWLDN